LIFNFSFWGNFASKKEAEFDTASRTKERSVQIDV
jgi:hypothetical protein